MIITSIFKLSLKRKLFKLNLIFIIFSSGDHSEIIEEIFQDKPNEIDSIFDAPPVELPERSKLQVEDLIAQKQVRWETRF